MKSAKTTSTGGGDPLVGMASGISKNYTYKCVDHSRHNIIKGAMTKCVCAKI